MASPQCPLCWNLKGKWAKGVFPAWAEHPQTHYSPQIPLGNSGGAAGDRRYLPPRNKWMITHVLSTASTYRQGGKGRECVFGDLNPSQRAQEWFRLQVSEVRVGESYVQRLGFPASVFISDMLFPCSCVSWILIQKICHYGGSEAKPWGASYGQGSVMSVGVHRFKFCSQLLLSEVWLMSV